MIPEHVLNKLRGQRFGQVVVDEEQSEYSMQYGELSARCDCGHSHSRFSPHALMSGNVKHCRGKAHKWTYALLASDVSMVKIGCADKIEPRIADLQRMSPASLTLIGVANDNIEALLHGNVSTRWSHGEWFRYDDEVRSAIESSMLRLDVSVLSFVRGKRGSVPCVFCGSAAHSCRDCDLDAPR